MILEPTGAASYDDEVRSASRASAPPRSRIEWIVDGRSRPVCRPERLLLDSNRFWRGYRLEWMRAPASGMLQRATMPQHRLIFVVRGTCDVRFHAYCREERHRLSPGTFAFIGRGYLFERLAWTGDRLEVVMVDIVDFGAEPNPIDAYGRTDALFDMRIGVDDARVAALIDLMRTEIADGCPTGAAYAEGLSMALASRIASLCASAPCERRRRTLLSSRQLQRVTEHVSAHLSQELTIERLAALVSMSPFHFARCFKQATGMTPHQHVLRERIAHARRMIAAGERSIGDIAMTLGFSSQSHFADVYRRMTGSSPRRDRRAG